MSDESPRTLGGLLALRAAKTPDSVFVTFAGREVRYAEFDAMVSRTAAGLAALGVVKGDRVALAAPNSVEFLTAWFAIIRLGAVEVPISGEFRAPQVRYVLADTEARLLICDAGFAGEHAEVLTGSPVERVLVVGDDAPPEIAGVASEGLPDADPAQLSESVAPGDVMAIIYTSGTTGDPKGVQICHEHEVTLAENIAASIDLGPDDCFYNFFPLHHNTGQGIITCAVMFAGARMLLTKRFSRSAFWKDVRSFGCTTFYGMGAIIEILNKDPDGPAAAAGHPLRIGWGIAIGDEQARRFEELFGVSFVTGYGSTEANMVAIDGRGGGPGAAGRIMPDFEVAIVDEEDEQVPVGEIGEIVIRPRRPWITTVGYWRKPEETVAAWRNMWLHTGDAGRIDAEGFLYFTDRIKDIIRHRGNNVSSLEVENIIVTMAGVAEVAVIPVASELGAFDQEVCAVIVPLEDAALDPADVIAICDAQLPSYAVPRFVDIVGELPKTPTGKVKKRELGGPPPSGRWDRDLSGITVKGGHKGQPTV